MSSPWFVWRVILGHLHTVRVDEAINIHDERANVAPERMDAGPARGTALARDREVKLPSPPCFQAIGRVNTAHFSPITEDFHNGD
jgi:hypothetical protein